MRSRWSISHLLRLPLCVLLRYPDRGGYEVLNAHSYKLPLEKKKATVIGCSNNVGLPIALLLSHKDMTCQLSHSHSDITPSLLKDVGVGAESEG